jgi:hypothetical protein
MGAPVDGVTTGVSEGVTAGVCEGVTAGVWEGVMLGVVCPGCAVWASDAAEIASSVAAPRIFNMWNLLAMSKLPEQSACHRVR